MALTKVQIDGVEFSDSTDLNVDNGTLVVDSTNNRVGVGTTSPGRTLDVNGVIRVDGTSAALAFGGNSSTPAEGCAIHRPASDQMAFVTNNTERLRIDSSGNVGINQTPTRELSLHSPNNNNSYIHFTNDDTGETSADGALVGIDGNEDLNVNNQESGKNVIFRNAGERMRIHSNGNLSLGATTNDSVGSTTTLTIDRASGNGQLSVAANGTVRGRIFADNSTSELRIGNPTANDLMLYTNNTERLRIDSSGRLLVGTSSSRSFNTHAGALQIDGDTYSESTVAIVSNSNTSDGAYLFFVKQRSGSAGGNTVVQNNDIIGEIRFNSGDGTDCESLSGQIQCLVDGTPGSNDVPGRLVFSTTADGASSPTERMRISNSGQIQINLPSNTTSRHIGIVNTSGTIGWTFGNGITSATRQFVVYDNEAGAARTVIDSSGNFKFNSGYGSAATAFGVRAWVNFNGTGTVAKREDGNVSSVVDNNTGDYDVNFTTSLVDANYSVVASCGTSANGNPPGIVSLFRVNTSGNHVTPTTSGFRITTSSTGGQNQDAVWVCVAVIR